MNSPLRNTFRHPALQQPARPAPRIERGPRVIVKLPKPAPAPRPVRRAVGYIEHAVQDSSLSLPGLLVFCCLGVSLFVLYCI